jgi:hypothetical protein
MPSPNNDIEIVTAIAIHGLVLSTLPGLTGWIDQAYVLIFACIVVALLIIALGFWARNRSMRWYGLGIVILCVAKLVVFD